MADRVLADDVYAVILTPLVMLWACVPTTGRKWFKSIPRTTIVYMFKIIWALAFYYWIYTLLIDYVSIPVVVSQTMGKIMLTASEYKVLIRSKISEINWTSFTALFPIVSIFGFISNMFKPKQPATVLEVLTKSANETADTISVATKSAVSFLAGSMGGLVYSPERAIQGSPLIPAEKLPSFQFFIMGEIGDKWTFVGCGFRAENALITAAHNLTGFEKIKIVTNTAEAIVDVENAVQCPDDLAFFLMSERDFSMLGLTKGKLLDHALTAAYPVVCQLYGPGTPVNFTIGQVRPVENFGKVSYGGTTTHGFSGSPYVQNKTVVGMHLGAGIVNIGLDAAYMAMLLSNRQESTEEWLLDMIEKDQLNKRPVQWEYSPVDPGDVYVKRQGKYFTVGADEFFSVYLPQRVVEESFTIKDKIMPMYSDSKNGATAPAQNHVSAGAPGQTSAITSCVQTQLSASSYQIPSSIKTLAENSDMDHQGPTPVQQNDPSLSTSINISYQQERNRRRQNQRNNRSNKNSLKSTNPGISGLEMIR